MGVKNSTFEIPTRYSSGNDTEHKRLEPSERSRLETGIQKLQNIFNARGGRHHLGRVIDTEKKGS